MTILLFFVLFCMVRLTVEVRLPILQHYSGFVWSTNLQHPRHDPPTFAWILKPQVRHEHIVLEVRYVGLDASGPAVAPRLSQSVRQVVLNQFLL